MERCEKVSIQTAQRRAQFEWKDSHDVLVSAAGSKLGMLAPKPASPVYLLQGFRDARFVSKINNGLPASR